MVVGKQRQYGGGAPMAISQPKIAINSGRQTPLEDGLFEQGSCCHVQHSCTPGQGRMVLLGCRVPAAPDHCPCSAMHGSHATASPQHGAPRNYPRMESTGLLLSPSCWSRRGRSGQLPVRVPGFSG